MDFKQLTQFKDIIVLDSRNVKLADRDTFNISWGIDKNYQVGAAISIASILENNKQYDMEFTFHIIADYLDDEYISLLTQLAEQYKTVIKIYYIDAQRFEDHEYGAVVVDVDAMQSKSAARLNNPAFQGNYFNSGVMYINLRAWLQSHLTERFFELLADEDVVRNIKYPDQDILNIMFLHHARILPREYNAIYSLKSEFEYKDKEYYKSFINDNTVFIHYTGVTKPWHDWAIYPSAEYFRSVYRLSPWKNIPYQAATRKHEYREKYKHLLYQNKIISGIVSAIKYNLMKG